MTSAACVTADAAPTDLAEQGVGVQDAQPHGHLVLLLQQQAVAGAAGHQVQGVADVEQSAYGVVDVAVRTVGDPGGGDGAQRTRGRAARRVPP